MRLNRIILVLSALALLSTFMGGYLYYSSLKKSISEREHHKAYEKIKSTAESIDQHITNQQKWLRVIAGEEEFELALTHKNEDALEDANAILDRICSSLDSADVCYLMDKRGETIASSNRNFPTSFTGKNYAYRPYFKNSLNGMPSLYMALGVTSKKRGIYLSQPVYGPDGKTVLGVLVVKESVSILSKEIESEKPVDGIIMLTDPNGIVFISSRKDWLYKALWDVSPQVQADIAVSRQFGNGPWNWTGLTRLNGHHAKDSSGNTYLVHSSNINTYNGWNLIYLHNLSIISSNIITPILKRGGYIVLPLFLLAGLMCIMLYKMALSEILKRKTTDEMLLQSKQDWEDTFNTITDMITVHDRNFNIIHANSAAEKILGLPALNTESLSKCYRHYHGKDSAPEGCPSCSCLNTEQPATFEIFEPHLNMYLEIRAIPRFDNSHQLTGLIHIVRDLTDKKKLESQLLQAQKMEAVGQLAGGVAHDFNNVLSAIINYGYLLKDMEVTDTSQEMIDKILSLSDKASNITQGLLAFSRKQYVESRPIDLNKVIRDTEKLFSKFIGEHIDFTLMLCDSELTIMADVTHLEQCIMNLATNGRDAMPGGGMLSVETGVVEIDDDFIKTHGYGLPGPYAVMTVSDSGTGMDEDTRKQIFDPFYTTKEVGKGTGLGLATVYGIIKQHKGYINVYSEPGTGTTFRLYFPLTNSKAESIIKDKPASLKGNMETILVAEDEPAVRESICTILERSGYNVIAAEDGIDAVAKCREYREDIELVLLDVIMPGSNGKEAYNEIHRTCPGMKAIFMSGYTADIIQKNNIIDENVSFISKPVIPAILISKIREVIDNEYGA